MIGASAAAHWNEDMGQRVAKTQTVQLLCFLNPTQIGRGNQWNVTGLAVGTIVGTGVGASVGTAVGTAV